MPLFSSIQDGFFSIKKTISVKAQSLWNHYYVQAPYQGLTAPLYNYTSVKNILNRSDDAKAEFYDTIKLNGVYAAKALVSYFIYYQLINPFLTVEKEENEAFQWTLLRLSALVASYTLKSVIDIYLYWEQYYVLSQNLSYAMDLPTTAAVVMNEEEKKLHNDEKHFVPCPCSDVDKTLAEGYSLFIYFGLRWFANKSSDITATFLPQSIAIPTSFLTTSFCFGYPLVEYKLSAVGNCFTHRFVELYKGNKTYVTAFGASFVLPYWFLNYATTKLTGANNDFFYDAEFNLLFQLFALLSIARIASFPGGAHPSFDVLNFLKKIWASAPVQAGYHLIEDRYAPRKFVTNRGTSNSIAKREKKIRYLLTIFNDGLERTKTIHESYALSVIESILRKLHCLPRREVRSRAHDIFSKMLNTLIASNNYLLELLEIALIADVAHRATRNVSSIQEQIQSNDRFIAATSTQKPITPQVKLLDEKKTEVVAVENKQTEEKFKVTHDDHFNCPKDSDAIDDDYEMVRPSSYVSQITLFPKRVESDAKPHKPKRRSMISRALRAVSR